MKKHIGQRRTLGFFWPVWCKAECGNSPLCNQMCVHTVKPEATHIWEKGDVFLGVNVEHFSVFHSFLQELRSRVWSCVSNSDKANERKSKERGGGERIHQGVCLQPERADSTGLGDEIRFSIRETCLSIVSKPLRRLKGTGICTWVSTSGREHGVMNYSWFIYLVLRNFSLFIVQEQWKKKRDKNLYHTCLLI